jgi:integrase/recombinase XerC
MLSNFNQQPIENWIDNAIEGIPMVKADKEHIYRFFQSRDYSPNSIRAILFDLRKFFAYFTTLNREPFDSTRITAMDLSGFKRDLREKQRQAVATTNRALVSIRRYLDWMVAEKILMVNPAKMVKELRRQRPVPKGLDRSQVRRLFRELELRCDVRSKAIFSLFFHTGCRVSDLVQAELSDIIISERSGSIVYRNGKGGKERMVPLPLAVRNALTDYLAVRPPVDSDLLFIGERGALTDIGVRAICSKYTAITGVKIHPHLCRHTFAKQYLESTNNDVVGLAQILGHNDLNTTKIYCQKTIEQVSVEMDRIEY